MVASCPPCGALADYVSFLDTSIEFLVLIGFIHYFNKGPKGPLIVHLNTMCHLCRRIGQDVHLGFTIDLKKSHNWKQTLISCFLSNFVEFYSAISEKSKLSQPIRGRGSHLIFLIRPKNTNLVKGIDILLPVKFP